MSARYSLDDCGFFSFISPLRRISDPCSLIPVPCLCVTLKSYGPHPHSSRPGRQPDRRRRGGGPAGLGGQGAAGERSRRGANRIRVEVEAGGRKLIRISRRRARHEPRRRPAGLRAPCHLEAAHRRRSALDRDPWLPGRSAALDCVGCSRDIGDGNWRRTSRERVWRSPAARFFTSTTRPCHEERRLRSQIYFSTLPPAANFCAPNQRSSHT